MKRAPPGWRRRPSRAGRPGRPAAPGGARARCRGAGPCSQPRGRGSAAAARQLLALQLVDAVIVGAAGVVRLPLAQPQVLALQPVGAVARLGQVPVGALLVAPQGLGARVLLLVQRRQRGDLLVERLGLPGQLVARGPRLGRLALQRAQLRLGARALAALLDGLLGRAVQVALQVRQLALRGAGGPLRARQPLLQRGDLLALRRRGRPGIVLPAAGDGQAFDLRAQTRHLRLHALDRAVARLQLRLELRGRRRASEAEGDEPWRVVLPRETCVCNWAFCRCSAAISFFCTNPCGQQPSMS